VTNSLKLPAIFVVGAIVSLVSQAQTEVERAAIEERIRPPGEVCLLGDTDCGLAVAVVASGPRSGEEVYNAACIACHDTGVGGAPMLGDVAAWADRIAKGADALYASGIEGVAGTSMVAKGGCMNCSDEEVNAAVDYMTASIR